MARGWNNGSRPGPGTHQLARLIDALERSVPLGQARMPEAMQEAVDRLGRRSLVIVVSDFFSPVQQLREGLARLRHERHETILLQVLDRDEMQFPFRNWVRCRGLEGERAQLVEPALVRRIYLENFRNHRRSLEEACRAMGRGVLFVRHGEAVDRLDYLVPATKGRQIREGKAPPEPGSLIRYGSAGALPSVIHCGSRVARLCS